jgi:hypothetical protein
MEMTELWEERIPFVEVCTSPKDKAIPVLERKLAESSGKRALRIAQALAMMGSESGAETIFKEIENQLSKSGSLPLLVDEIMHTGGPFRPPPDQGAMPLFANLINALGMTRSKLNIKAWELVSERFEAGELDDFRSRDRSLFNYVDAVCYGAGLLGHPDAIPSLIKIHSNRFLNGQSIKSGIQVDFILERLGLLELILGRALARCGSIQGLQIMIEYLDDFRGILTEFAHTTLIRITNEDFGKNKQKWGEWIRSHANDFKPVPLEEREDG